MAHDATTRHEKFPCSLNTRGLKGDCSQRYLLTAASIALPALARSSGTITG